MRLKVGFSPNIRLQPLLDGAVKVEGVELDWEFQKNPGALFHRQLTENCYDAFEFSIGAYMISQRPDWIALPVFMSKPLGLLTRFHVNVDSGIQSFADFRGKSFGLPDYSMTAGVWLRIMLRILDGIQAQEISWYNARPAESRHGRLLDVDHDTSTGVKIVNLERPTDLNEHMQRGEIDAGYGDDNVPVEETSKVRLFTPPAVVHRWLADFYQASGSTPTNHTLAIKRQLLDDDPSLAERLYAGFKASKEEAYRRAKHVAEAYLFFPELAFEDQASAFGEDPYPFGLERNRTTLALIADQLRLDGLVEDVDLDRLWLDLAA